MEELYQYLSNRHKPKNINTQHKQSLSLQERIALMSTNILGTMYAVYIILISIAVWMIWQSWFTNKPFDPYPFAFLLFIGSIIQLPIMSLIMVGQNLQGRHSELRAEEEFRATQSSSKDIEKIIKLLADQETKIKQLTKLVEELKTTSK